MYVLNGYELRSIFDIAIISSNLNHSFIIEIQKFNSICEKLRDILQETFDEQKSYGDRRKNRTRYLCARKVLVKINVRQNTFSTKYEGSHTIFEKK